MNMYQDALNKVNESLTGAVTLLNEHRAMLQEADSLLDEAVERILYGGDASTSSTVHDIRQWQERLGALLQKPI